MTRFRGYMNPRYAISLKPSLWIRVVRFLRGLL